MLKAELQYKNYFFSQNCEIYTRSCESNSEGKKTDMYSELQVYLSKFGLNSQLCVIKS